MSCAPHEIANAERASGTADALARILALLDARLAASPHLLDEHAAAFSPLLAWLIRNGGVETRRAVAASRHALADAGLHLSEDRDGTVRAELARRVSWCLSALDDAAETVTHRVLKRLSRDDLLQVRTTLAQEIRHLCEVPKEIVLALAHDRESAVAGPILEFSPLLREEDLLEVIKAGAKGEVLSYVARRRPLSANLTDAIAIFLDHGSLEALLLNPDAEIRPETLEYIARHVDRFPGCLGLLVARTDLSVRAVRSIAKTADIRTIERLATTYDSDRRLSAFLARRLRERPRDPSIDDAGAVSARASNDRTDAAASGLEAIWAIVSGQGVRAGTGMA
jgi:hypothetical protein